ncbi:protein ASYMMETRIC LEAVES 2 [Cryptomeria japonica]|uniref:protein ASYMMETRIC LEAVES 2 n=1 Tax=Cryptomeria japonica TaxID=3369 RepID=UPI0025AD31B5|nr:protein ASYMMETRIC LEAVES 2 [Cryptomeria japonica]
MASSSNSPCAACKFLRRKCTPECVFAPYFPPDQPQKFANVHKVFGASNVTKLLNELHPHQREDAVNSLAYEADARLRDPVYGCVGVISLLQHQLKQLQSDLTTARSELSKYINAGMAGPLLGGPSSNLGIGMGLPGTASRDHLFRDQVMEAQISTREQQMYRNYDQEIARISVNAYDPTYGHLNVSPTLGPLNPFAPASRAASDERNGGRGIGPP